MARRKSAGRARAGGTGWKLRLLGAVLLIAIVAGAWGWWHLRHWTPDRAIYPVQGVEIGVDDGPVNWKSIKAIGADFAYIDASASAFARDPRFVENFEAARAIGMQVGAVHRYDPCQPAEKQAANFVTTVPRDADLLPPVVDLEMLAGDCPVKVSDAKVESELMTFLNQVETHAGKAVILKVSPGFESRYQVANKLDRNLWLMRDRLLPDYGGRPWTLWTANGALANEVAADGLRWVVVQP
ncbi:MULTISPECIES: glycoside hydrolase family 25 protein [unclassified Novosphingobium]|uniref:glycoside hydrolase family 25 protein n=1 Tax=unclassified Novosphingobium TaxID=2644732 RepID=UPI00020EF4AC|nr:MULTISPECIES: GH25 family lysozyme [unclassified Novosphingobium]GFM29898.1 glycoside hydrolase [Novosphingobium sp. PY1]CCA92818.1 glycoside hydrolase family protein [Novosphingobium sp. PP1Y]